MRIGWLGAGALAFAAFTAGGMKVAIDAAAGPGTTKAAFDYGVGSTSEMVGEAAQIPGQVIEDLKPALADLRNQAGGLFPAAPSAAVPTVDPSDAADGTQP
jgi:hypothetical protein